MQFEDLQVIWNSQHDRPLYGFDEAGLQQVLRGNRQRFQRFLFRCVFDCFFTSHSLTVSPSLRHFVISSFSLCRFVIFSLAPL